MSFWDRVYPSLKKRPSGATLAWFVAVLFVGVLLLPSCLTQRAWREQATTRYCTPTEIEDISVDSWRVLCTDERVMRCSRDATQPNATWCVEIR